MTTARPLADLFPRLDEIPLPISRMLRSSSATIWSMAS